VGLLSEEKVSYKGKLAGSSSVFWIFWLPFKLGVVRISRFLLTWAIIPRGEKTSPQIPLEPTPAACPMYGLWKCFPLVQQRTIIADRRKWTPDCRLLFYYKRGYMRAVAVLPGSRETRLGEMKN